jgi:hypothetical protein
VATCFFALIGWRVFSWLPLYIDELTQALQANIFLSGRLWAPVREPTELFATFQMVEVAGRTFAQYTPGWPALLALGELIGLRWLMGPLAGGVAVAVLLLLLLRLGERPRVALGGALLLMLSPWSSELVTGPHGDDYVRRSGRFFSFGNRPTNRSGGPCWPAWPGRSVRRRMRWPSAPAGAWLLWDSTVEAGPRTGGLHCGRAGADAARARVQCWHHGRPVHLRPGRPVG